MKMLKIILLVVFVLIVIILAFYAYYGGFTSVEVRTEMQGGETVVYEEVTGDYSQTGTVSDRVYNDLLDGFQIETTKGFGIFYDNPQQVDKDKLRSEVGCILDFQPDSAKIAELSKKFKVKILPKTNYVVTEFPFKGQMSIMVSLFRVYPAIQKYIDGNGINGNSPVMEIYDIPNGKIVFRKEVVN